jgi:hypothetical protein
MSAMLRRATGVSAALAAMTAVLCFSGAHGWMQTVPRDPQAPPPKPLAAPVRDRVPTPRIGTGALKGRVVDGVTGRPIARARVRLTGAGVSRGPVLTDGTGAFTFDRLVAGGYRVSAEKSTYINGMYPDPQRSIRNRMQQLMIADGQVLEDVTIQLFHSAAIAGRIVDAHGDPIEGAMVSVMTPPRAGRPTMRGSTQSNDLGEFRISRLSAGRYILVVRPQPTFYGGPDNAPILDPPVPQPVPTYYPGTLALDEARPIVLNRGETITGIDMTLGEGVPSMVTGLVIPADGQTLAGGNVMARSANTDGGFGFESNTGVRPDGTFRIGLTPGEYILEARSYPRTAPGEQNRQENEQVGTARVTVTGSGAESVTIQLGRGATATGRVVFEGSTPPPAPPEKYALPLYNPNGPGCRPAQAIVASDWSFKVDGLSGTCGVQPGNMFGRWTLKAVMVRGQNLIDRMVTFETGQSYTSVTIVVTDKRTIVDIGVTDESGQPTHEYAALVFPADKDRWAQLQRYVRTAAPIPASVLQAQAQRGAVPLSSVISPTQLKPGISRMVNLPAGEYYAIAVDDMDPEDTMEPNVLEKLIPSATRVNVTEDGPIEIILRRFNFSDVIR